MKKLFAFVIAAIMSISLAHAASQTIEFTNDESGESQTWKFNSDGTAVGPNDVAATYKWDAETKTLCVEIAGDEPQKICATFEEAKEDPEVGFETKYKTDNGQTGVAKVIAVEADE